MAEVSFPFENADSNEPEWQKMARHWLATGVITGYLNQLAVTADGLSMSVSRDTGGAWVEGFYYEDVVAKAVPIEAAHATNPRIDRIVLRLDRLANSIVVAVLKGVDDGTLALTALTQTSGVYEILVADVRVDAAVGVIAANKVTDRRAFSKNLTEAAASAAYLAIGGKAADADKLDGVDSSLIVGLEGFEFAAESTTSGTFANLTTFGPLVDFTTGPAGIAVVDVSANCRVSAGAGTAVASFTIFRASDGVVVVAPDDSRSCMSSEVNASGQRLGSGPSRFALAPNTSYRAHMSYRQIGTVTATFGARRINVRTH